MARRPLGPPVPVHRVLLAVIAAAAAGTVVGLFVLWPSGTGAGLSEFLGPPVEMLDAKVVAADDVPCPGAVETDDVRCVELSLELTTGPDRGSTVVIENSQGGGAPVIETGDRLVVGYTPGVAPGGQYYIADFQRRTPMLLLAGLFVVAVVALARVRGLRALVGLGISLAVLLVFMLPAILEGRSPVAVAVVGSAAILLVNLYLAHGINLQTSTAVVGTLLSLALIGVLAAAFVAACNFSGLASEEASFLQAASTRISLQGLLLGGIVIGSLGVLDDVTVTQASAVWELHQANPTLGPAGLYRSALRIGRDHIASTVNTLVLAYAGASLPLLVLLVEANQGLGQVLTGEVIAVEVVRTLVGSIGLVAAVPITTALAAVVVAGRGSQSPAVA